MFSISNLNGDYVAILFFHFGIKIASNTILFSLFDMNGMRLECSTAYFILLKRLNEGYLIQFYCLTWFLFMSLHTSQRVMTEKFSISFRKKMSSIQQTIICHFRDYVLKGSLLNHCIRLPSLRLKCANTVIYAPINKFPIMVCYIISYRGDNDKKNCKFPHTLVGTLHEIQTNAYGLNFGDAPCLSGSV